MQSENQLKTAITDGFGSTLIEIMHVASETVDLLDTSRSPRVRVDAALNDHRSSLIASFFISSINPPSSGHENGTLSWSSKSTDGGRGLFRIEPIVEEKSKFDEYVAELFWKAAQVNLDLAADLVRIDKEGGRLRRAALRSHLQVQSLNKVEGSVAIIVCNCTDNLFMRATISSLDSTRYASADVAVIWDYLAGREADTLENSRDCLEKIKEFNSIYLAEDSFLTKYSFVLLLPAGAVVSRQLHVLVDEAIQHIDDGKLIQLRTGGNPRRLDALSLRENSVMRPRDFPLTGFYPILISTRDLRQILSGRRCYASALSVIFDLLRGLDVLEMPVGADDGIIQIAPPPISFHSREVTRLVRDCLEATISGVSLE